MSGENDEHATSLLGLTSPSPPLPDRNKTKQNVYLASSSADAPDMISMSSVVMRD